jgi:type I restriction enzyme S subunit
MRKGWKVIALGEVCEVVNGGTPKTGVSDYWDGPHQWITPAEMGKRSSPYIEATVRTVTELGLQNSSATPLPAYSVILSSRAPIGHLVINTVPMATNLGCKGLVPSKKVQYKFLYHYLTSIVDLLNDLGTGATFKELSGGKLKEVTVPLPPLPEQHRIVAILDEAFDGITTAKANAEKNLLNARALFDSHLNDVFSQRGKGWKQKTLEEISTIFGRGKSRHRPRNEPTLYGGEYPFIQTGDIRNADHFIKEYTQTYSEAGLAQSKLWPKGTICITIAANIAETGILDFDACFPDSVIGVVTNPKEVDIDYVEYLLQSYKVRIQAMGKGSAQANINMGTFENERFPFPTVTEQKKIVGKLNSLSEETQHLESIYRQKISALDALKKSLLDQAFRGELVTA